MAALNLSDLPFHSEGVGECLVIGKFSILALVVTPWGEVAGPPTSVPGTSQGQ